MRVLALDVTGTPRRWINFDKAITYYAKGSVVWSLGDVVARYHGGYQRDANQSILETPSIIAVKGPGFDVKKHGRVGLSNTTLFGRDRFVCAYCGKQHTTGSNLSRDHIVPRSRGGMDNWMNVVTSCKSCNAKKGNKTLKEAKMELLYVPYVPNHFEDLILRGRNIIKDQMEYLIAGVPKHSRIILN